MKTVAVYTTTPGDRLDLIASRFYGITTAKVEEAVAQIWWHNQQRFSTGLPLELPPGLVIHLPELATQALAVVQQRRLFS